MAKRKYLVIGPNKVMNRDPGEEFSADLPAEQERALVEGGHIKPVEQRSPRSGGKSASNR